MKGFPPGTGIHPLSNLSGKNPIYIYITVSYYCWRDSRMRRRAAFILVIALLLPSFPGLPGGSSEGASGRAMFTTLTHFFDNSTGARIDFLENGRNSSISISVPATALMKSATVEIGGEVLEKEDSLFENTTADFLAGTLNNISVQNGSLVLKPILKQTTYNASSHPASIAAGDVNYDGHTDIVVANSGSATIGVFCQNWSVPKLGAQSTYAVGTSPQGVAVGDLNYDGLQDVGVACSGTGTLEVLLQKQDGTLAAAVTYASGNGACALAIGDFNRDGRKDVVTVNSVDSTLTLFIQNTTGTLYKVGAFGTGSNPLSVATGDINLDGRDEAVAACKDSSTICVFVQNATTGLKQAASYNVGSGPVSVAIGDINRDGRNDVTVAEQTAGAIGVLAQNQTGLLAQCVEHNAGGVATGVAVGDLDLNGRTDIAVTLGGGNVSVFWQRHDGTISARDDYRAGSGPAAVVIADLNSDGKNDIACANSGDNTVGVLPLRPLPPGGLNQMASYNVGTTPIGLAAGDLNTDGLDDILVGNAAGAGAGVLLQGQTGALNPQVAYLIGMPLGVAVCDLNRDGRDDIVMADRSTSDPNYLIISNQTQAGDFSGTAVKYNVPLPYGLVYIVACGDLNSDGCPDIAVSSVVNTLVPPYTEPDNVTVFIQNASSGQFDIPYNVYCPGSRGVAIGDINSDGKNDLCVAAATTNELWVFLQAFNGTLASTPVKYSTDTSPHGLRIGDLNADGRNDIVTADWTAMNVNVFLQNQAGTFNPRAWYSVSNSQTDSAVDVEIGDYDSDGLNDLAVSHYTGHASVSILNQTRQGIFSSFVGYNSGQAPAYLASGDLNGDGKMDVAVANRNSNTVGVFTQQLNPDINGTFTSRFRQLPYDIFQASALWNYSTTGVNQTPMVWLSNDRGASWIKAVQGEPVFFAAEGDTIGYRVRLASGALNLTPCFENITIHYLLRSYPANPSLDIGATGTHIWNWTGPFGLSRRPAIIDFMARLNATLVSTPAGPDGNIRLPFVVSSGSLGSISLTNLSVQYDLVPSVPELKRPADGEYLVTPEPSFSLIGRDADTTMLLFKIELSQDNFTTLKRIYNQRTSPDGWDKEFYMPGEVATFQLSHADRLTTDGAYQWRAYVWDDTLWSISSAIGRFRLDTKPPVARVLPLPLYINGTDFMVSWNGSDPEPGSGLAPEATYDIQYKDRDSSAWMDWLQGTNETQAKFTGTQGKTYYFQAMARDRAGISGHFVMGSGDTRTTVDITPPAGVITDDGITTVDNTRLHAVLSFSDPESGVVRYEYWVGTRTGDAGNDVFGPAISDKKDVAVTGLFLTNGTRYYFTVRAQNGAGIWSASQSSDGISVKLKVPVASVAYLNGSQKASDIPLRLESSDPNGIGVADADLEYRVARFQNRSATNWSDWKDIGESDWGDAKPGIGPFVFTGEPGRAYRFRYRVRDIAGTFSDFADPGNVTRINRAPVPVISAPGNATAGRGIEFWSNGSYDPDGDRLNFTWDFGDGKMDYGKAVTHIFTRGKRYAVTLYVDDSLENVSVQIEIRIQSLSSSTSFSYLTAPFVITAVVAASGILFAVLARRRKKQVPASRPGLTEAAPSVVPGSERLAPPAPPSTAVEVEAQIAAARTAVTELEQLGVETSRATKMLGLAISFLADGNLEMASQYSKKASKLARDQKQRKESEVDEETARRFVTETQKMLEVNETTGLNVKEAKKLFGLSISFLAEGNYVTGMQYSKKVRRILEELRERQAAMPATNESVSAELESLGAITASIQRAGENILEIEKELDMARMFWHEQDYKPAMEHVSLARILVQDLKEKGRAYTPQQWKDKLNMLKERIERSKGEGIRMEEPAKMLRLSESFALQGNLEVASQFIRKVEMLLNDMGDRARVDAQKREGPTKKAPHCPRCGEGVEADWVVCAYCNARLKADVPAAPEAKTSRTRATGTPGQIRVARAVDDPQEWTTDRRRQGTQNVLKVARPIDGAMGRKEAPGRCPSCGTDIEPDWKVCPSCEYPF
jgi:hypothetical protein